MSEVLPKRLPYNPRKLPDQDDEFFVVVDNEAEAKFVDRRLNTQEARLAKQARLHHLLMNGVVHEAEMPDTQSRIRHEYRIWEDDQWSRAWVAAVTAGDEEAKKALLKKKPWKDYLLDVEQQPEHGIVVSIPSYELDEKLKAKIGEMVEKEVSERLLDLGKDFGLVRIDPGLKSFSDAEIIAADAEGEQS